MVVAESVPVQGFDPSSGLVVATGLAALFAVLVDGLWRWARGVVTIVHEAGHATVAAGFLSPSLVGLAGVGLLALDQVTVMLWTGAAALVAMLVMVRNAYGALALLVTGGAVVAVSLRAPADVQAAFGYTMTWFLLIGAVRPVSELWQQRRRHPGRRSDADHLDRLTGIPAAVWVLVFGLTTLAALGSGGWLLLASTA